MSMLEDIRSSITSLSRKVYVQIRILWFTKEDWGEWDREIEEDSTSGKLDFLKDEAVSEKPQKWIP